MSEKPEKDMVIYLSGDQQAAEPEPLPSFDELTPREIVVDLVRVEHVAEAKKGELRLRPRT